MSEYIGAADDEPTPGDLQRDIANLELEVSRQRRELDSYDERIAYLESRLPVLP